MKLALVILAAGVLGAQAVCPNSCSGHGTCNAYDECSCFDEGKSVYFGYLYDTAKGFNRITNTGADTATAEATGTLNRVFSKGAFVQKQWTGADCSLQTCSRGVSWTTAHQSNVCLHSDFVECSDQGLCDRSTGQCACFPGYEGAACQRTVCQNECFGHGICQSNVDFSVDASIADTTSAYGRDKRYLGAWDSGLHLGCKCDLGFRARIALSRSARLRPT